MTPRICIIILNWNGKNDTLACLKSLQELTYSNYEVLIVDNGSSDDSVAAIQEKYPQHLLIETGKNLGFAEGNNVGIRLALERGADLLFLLNNDTVVASDILERFVEGFEAHAEAGILGAKIFLHSQREVLDHLGGMWCAKTGTFKFVGLREPEDGKRWQEAQEIDYVCGAGLILRRDVVEAVGLLEPRFFLIWEESDLCFRARQAGFKTMTCPRAKLWHKVSASFVGGKPHSTYFWWRNRLLWIERNCPQKERWSLILTVLLPSIAKMAKNHLLKKVQFSLSRWFLPAAKQEEKRLKLLKNRAALCGVRDYLLRRFGDGPSWIYRK